MNASASAVHSRVGNDTMLTYREAATMLGVPLGTLYAWVHARAVPHVRLGARLVRFRRGELERWLDERSVSGAREPKRNGDAR